MNDPSRVGRSEDPAVISTPDTSGKRVVAVAIATDSPTRPDALVEDERRRYATLIGQLGDIPTEPFALPATPNAPDNPLLSEHGLDVAALVITHPRGHWARAVPAAAAHLPTVTDHDALAITLTTAVLTALSRARRPTAHGRVLIVQAHNLPQLAPLLIAAEAGEVTSWNTPDQERFPLHRASNEAEVIVNLLGDIAEPAPDNQATVITADWANHPPLVLPGLARALYDLPDAHLDPSDPFGAYYDVCHACALTLVMATPPDQLTPPTASRDLSTRVAAAATAAFRAARKTTTDEGPWT
jgi:hypothetical protein